MITAVRSFENEIKTLLKESGVKTFSYMNIMGFKDLSDEPLEANWFASSTGERLAVLFYAFVEKTITDEVIAHIEERNSEQETLSQIHVAVMDIKRTNKI